MAAPRGPSRRIRRLAFQALLQIDARGITDAADIRQAMEEPLEDYTEGYTTEEKDEAFALAVGAFDDRKSADDTTKELAPTWPAHRQAAVDRAILRLAHYEMTSGTTPPKIAVNEAVELAKEFSTDRSPAFVNALLDKVLKRVLKPGGGAPDKGEPSPDIQVRSINPGPHPGAPPSTGEPSSHGTAE